MISHQLMLACFVLSYVMAFVVCFLYLTPLLLFKIDEINVSTKRLFLLKNTKKGALQLVALKE